MGTLDFVHRIISAKLGTNYFVLHKLVIGLINNCFAFSNTVYVS